MLQRLIVVFFGLLWIYSFPGLPPPAEAADPKGAVPNIELYFPSETGSEWRYLGTVVDQIQRVGNYVNVTTISGTTVKNGVQVQVFSETNQADNGPADSYFSIDQYGITYYGSSPTTTFEKQIVPYKIVSFPVYLHQNYPQLDKRGLNFGRDLDQDGTDEQVDVIADIAIDGLEPVSVPGGVFNGCLKMTGTMNLYITLSSSHKVVKMVDITTNWFAPGVGLVKGIERTDFPSINGSPAQSTEIIEELQSTSIGGKSRH